MLCFVVQRLTKNSFQFFKILNFVKLSILFRSIIVFITLNTKNESFHNFTLRVAILKILGPTTMLLMFFPVRGFWFSMNGTLKEQIFCHENHQFRHKNSVFLKLILILTLVASKKVRRSRLQVLWLNVSTR